jgi:hypothetical protein
MKWPSNLLVETPLLFYAERLKRDGMIDELKVPVVASLFFLAHGDIGPHRLDVVALEQVAPWRHLVLAVGH